MKQRDAYKELHKVLNDERIVLHRDCFEEICKLVLSTGQEAAFIKKFSHQVSRLLRDGRNAIGSPGLENLKHSSGICSMHVNTNTLNLRVLFDLKEGNVQFLLVAFHERAGKKNTNYHTKISEAQKRLTELF